MINAMTLNGQPISDYRIVYRRTGESGIFADGKPVTGTLLPDFRDGKTHLIEVTI